MIFVVVEREAREHTEFVCDRRRTRTLRKKHSKDELY